MFSHLRANLISICRHPTTKKSSLQYDILKHNNNYKEWLGMGFGDSLSAAEDREGWKGIIAKSSVVPRRPPRLRD